MLTPNVPVYSVEIPDPDQLPEAHRYVSEGYVQNMFPPSPGTQIDHETLFHSAAPAHPQDAYDPYNAHDPYAGGFPPPQVWAEPVHSSGMLGFEHMPLQQPLPPYPRPTLDLEMARLHHPGLTAYLEQAIDALSRTTTTRTDDNKDLEHLPAIIRGLNLADPTLDLAAYSIPEFGNFDPRSRP
jgi:hypothetical protein